MPTNCLCASNTSGDESSRGESNESNDESNESNELTGPSGPLRLLLRHTLASYNRFLR